MSNKTSARSTAASHRIFLSTSVSPNSMGAIGQHSNCALARPNLVRVASAIKRKSTTPAGQRKVMSCGRYRPSKASLPGNGQPRGAKKISRKETGQKKPAASHRYVRKHLLLPSKTAFLRPGSPYPLTTLQCRNVSSPEITVRINTRCTHSYNTCDSPPR